MVFDKLWIYGKYGFMSLIGQRWEGASGERIGEKGEQRGEMTWGSVKERG